MVFQVCAWERQVTKVRVPEDVSDDLEVALTRIDSSGSDDEPLVRLSSGRNVVPRTMTEGSQVRQTSSVRRLQSAQVVWLSEANDEDVIRYQSWENSCARFWTTSTFCAHRSG